MQSPSEAGGLPSGLPVRPQWPEPESSSLAGLLSPPPFPRACLSSAAARRCPPASLPLSQPLPVPTHRSAEPWVPLNPTTPLLLLPLVFLPCLLSAPSLPGLAMDFAGPSQNENVGPFVQMSLRISRWQQLSGKPSTSMAAFWAQGPCDHAFSCNGGSPRLRLPVPGRSHPHAGGRTRNRSVL